MKNLLHSLMNSIQQNKKYIIIAVGSIAIIIGCVIGILLSSLFRPGTGLPSNTNQRAELEGRYFNALARHELSQVNSAAALALVAELQPDPETGELLMQDYYAIQPDVRHLSASLIKLVTLVSYQKAVGFSLTDTIAVSPAEDFVQGPSFPADSTVTSVDLAHALLIASSNQSAETLARLAQTKNSNLLDVAGRLYPQITTATVSGLDSSSSMTPRDAIRLAYTFSHLRADIAAVSIQPSVVLGAAGVYPNTNTSLSQTPEVYFSKTGFTDSAGGNLVVLAKICNRDFGLVVMGDTYLGRFASIASYVRALRESCDTAKYLVNDMMPVTQPEK